MSAQEAAIRFVVGYDNLAHSSRRRVRPPYSRLICLMADVSYGYGPGCVGWPEHVAAHPLIVRWQRWIS